MKNEINILIESLEKKKEILNEILANSEKQLEIINSEQPDLEEFDRSVDQKTELVQKMDQNDQGFDRVFNRIKNALIDDQAQYSAEIRTMQGLIREILDLGSEIHNTETRTQDSLGRYLKDNKSRLRKGRRDSKAVFDYYKQASQTKYVTPMFMDQKQ